MTHTSRPGIGTFATGYAATSEPPTFISIEHNLERQAPDGSWNGIWSSNPLGCGGPTQNCEKQSALIYCDPGRYRWHMRVQFAGRNTTSFRTTPSFVM